MPLVHIQSGGRGHQGYEQRNKTVNGKAVFPLSEDILAYVAPNSDMRAASLTKQRTTRATESRLLRSGVGESDRANSGDSCRVRWRRTVWESRAMAW